MNLEALRARFEQLRAIVEQLIEKTQSGGLPDWDDDSPIIASSSNSNNTYWELTEKGTLMWKLTNPEKSGKAVFSSGSDLYQIPLNYKAIMSKIKQVYISDGITDANVAWAIKCERVRFPDSLVTVPTLVNGISVKELDISDGNFVKLADYIYNNANALKKIKLSPNITTINRNSFSNCYSLKEIDLKNILIFKTLCFLNCAALDKDIVFNPDLISIESQAFDTSGIKSVKFQNSVDGLPTIANNAFNRCRELTDIYCPWAEDAVANAPWGATNATIHYNYNAEV